MISIENFCCICGIISAVIGGLLTHIFIINWGKKVITYFKIDYPDEIIEEIVTPTFTLTFWAPCFLSIFYGYFAFPLLYIPQVQSIDFMTKQNIYLFIIINLILHIIIIILGMTISVLTNKRLVTITPSERTKFWGPQHTNRNILISEMSSVSYRYRKVMEIKLKNGSSFKFGVKQFDKFFKKLNSMLKNNI